MTRPSDANARISFTVPGQRDWLGMSAGTAAFHNALMDKVERRVALFSVLDNETRRMIMAAGLAKAAEANRRHGFGERNLWPFLASAAVHKLGINFWGSREVHILRVRIDMLVTIEALYEARKLARFIEGWKPGKLESIRIREAFESGKPAKPALHQPPGTVDGLIFATGAGQ